MDTANATSNASTTPQSAAAAAANTAKTEQKPVECNLCHRKFKNIPALNGHMRLHGGYFKKDAEAKKCDKKETPGPPLQTASVGIRALIEEKIISKRGKDILKVSICLSFTILPLPCIYSHYIPTFLSSGVRLHFLISDSYFFIFSFPFSYRIHLQYLRRRRYHVV